MKNFFAAVIEFPSPIENKTVLGLANNILSWMIWIALPIAVIMILYAGITLLTANGIKNRIDSGKKILTWAVIGLAVILIGNGFITLIQSIINLGAGK
jgi:uncharacterized membrane protein YjfL (UPF0719 family)